MKKSKEGSSNDPNDYKKSIGIHWIHNYSNIGAEINISNLLKLEKIHQ